MDFNAYRKKMIFDNIMNSHLQNEQYERDMMSNYVTNQPFMKPIQPPMPFLSSYTNPDRYAFDGLEYDVFTGSGVAEDNVLRGLLQRNASIQAQNKAELQADETGTFDTQEDEDTSSQKQSLELYFNELQDGGFGGTDINRENTRKALFNLKAIGLNLNLNTIQRYKDIVNEFIDSFVLSVQNPQFSEILNDGRQNLTVTKRVEILKASLKNLDSIENVLRILKVLDVLEETYNTQDIQREPIFEARFNDIIEAKPTQYIPQQLRALLTRANKTFEQIKDKLQGIQEVRQDIKRDDVRITSDRADMRSFNAQINQLFTPFMEKYVNEEFNKIKKSNNGLAWTIARLNGVQYDFEKILTQFFKTKKTRKLVANILSNITLNSGQRQNFINLVNGSDGAETELQNVNEVLWEELKDSMRDYISGMVNKLRRRKADNDELPERIEEAREVLRKPKARQAKPAQPVQPAQPKPQPKQQYTPSQAPLPKKTPTEARFFEAPELLEQMNSAMKPLGDVHPRANITSISPTTNLNKAKKQQDEAVELLDSKMKRNSRAKVTKQQKIAVENAKMIVDSILRNNQFKAQRGRLDDIQRRLEFSDDGRAFPDEAQQKEQDIRRAEQEAEERAKAQALEQAQEQLARQQAEEQKGQGRRKKAPKSKGGKKAQAIDSEHKARLKALFN